MTTGILDINTQCGKHRRRITALSTSSQYFFIQPGHRIFG